MANSRKSSRTNAKETLRYPKPLIIGCGLVFFQQAVRYFFALHQRRCSGFGNLFGGRWFILKYSKQHPLQNNMSNRKSGAKKKAAEMFFWRNQLVILVSDWKVGRTKTGECSIPASWTLTYIFGVRAVRNRIIKTQNYTPEFNTLK